MIRYSVFICSIFGWEPAGDGVKVRDMCYVKHRPVAGYSRIWAILGEGVGAAGKKQDFSFGNTLLFISCLIGF
jgi:hypothetical protein